MISVCMATYNGERFLNEQIDSILPQLSVYDELVMTTGSCVFLMIILLIRQGIL